MGAPGGFDVDAQVARLSAAVRELTQAGECRQAAMACVELGQTYENALGNLTASRAWFARATRLLAHEPPCAEQGWVAMAAMGCDVDDPAALLAAAELALERARRFGDVNLETKALADAGLAHVQSGRIAEGMALLRVRRVRFDEHVAQRRAEQPSRVQRAGLRCLPERSV